MANSQSLSIVRPMPRLQENTAHEIRQCSTSRCVSEATTGESAPDDAVPVPSAKRGAHAGNALVRNPLHQANVKANLVPFDRRADDLDKREGDLGVPLLGGLEDEVVQRLPDLGVLAVVLQAEGRG